VTQYEERNLIFVIGLTLAFAVEWKLGVVTVQPEDTAVKQLLGRILAPATAIHTQSWGAERIAGPPLTPPPISGGAAGPVWR
jgi:hypothetical protein